MRFPRSLVLLCLAPSLAILGTCGAPSSPGESPDGNGDPDDQAAGRGGDDGTVPTGGVSGGAGAMSEPGTEPGEGGKGGATASSPGAWWDDAWPKRRRLTFNLATAGEVSDVPLLVSLPRTDAPSDDAASAERGVRFVSQDGKVLPHEVDGVSDTSILVWVRVPDPTSELWVYTGHDAAPDLPEAHRAAVWGTDAVVWHLEGDGHESGPGAFSVHASEDEGVAPPFAQGRIGRGYLGDSSKRTSLGLSRDAGANRSLLAGATAISLSAWVRPTALTLLGDKPFERQVLAVGTTKEDSNFNHAAAFLGLALEKKDASSGGEVVVGARPSGDEEKAAASKAVKKNVWTHVVAMVDLEHKRGRLFVDGAPASDWVGMGDLEATAYAADHQAKSGHIGASAGGGYGFFDGGIDEVRLQRHLLTDAWVRATYENMADPENTVLVGALELHP